MKEAGTVTEAPGKSRNWKVPNMPERLPSVTAANTFLTGRPQGSGN